MDPRAPTLAIISRMLALFFLGLIAINMKFNLLGPKGWDYVENLLIMKAVAFFAISVWANQENEITDFDRNYSVEQQRQAMEMTATRVRSSATTVDVHGFETVNHNPQTSAIINSIVGSNNSQQGNVSSAINLISSSEIGMRAAQEAHARPAPHRDTVQQREVVQEQAQVIQDDFERVPVVNVPLPGQPASAAVASAPVGMVAKGEFVTQGLAQIPLPSASQPVTQQAVQATPVVSDLDELFVEDSPVVNSPAVPDIGDLDDLLSDLPTTPAVVSQPVTSAAPVVEPVTYAATPDIPDLDDLF